MTEHLAAALSALCVAVILSNAFFQVDGIRESHRYTLYPFDQGSYEESEVFHGVFETSVRDIVTMAVIRTQLETDGVFDGKKKIDIASYVNRKNTVKTDNISTEYYLEDLIKWSQYGFSYETVDPEIYQGCSNDEDAFLKYRTREILGGTSKEKGRQEKLLRQDTEETISITYEDGDTVEVTQVDNSDEDVEEDIEESPIEDGAGLTLLNERYLAVDGTSILEHVDSLEDYKKFVSTLQDASNQLAYNYELYQEFHSSYDSDNTNIRYCLMIPNGNGYRYFCNVEGISSSLEKMSLDAITENFKHFGEYLYYYPEHLEYVTNMVGIGDSFIREALEEYSYIYPEQSRIWIGIDTNYPVFDGMAAGKVQYIKFMPYYIYWVIGAVVSGLIWLGLFLTSLVKEWTDDQLKMKASDYIPAEIMCILAGGIALLFALVLITLWYSAVGGGYYVASSRPVILPKNDGLLWGMPALGIFLSLGNQFFLLSLVRRIRLHVFWHNTIVGWCVRKVIGFFQWIWKKLNQFSDTLSNTERRSIVMRVWGPYVLFLGVNFVCLLIMCVVSPWWIGMLFAILFDAAIGVLMFRCAESRSRILDGIESIRNGDINHQIDIAGMHGDNLALASAVNRIGDAIRIAVETSMKDERLKTELITNVSHDIKTPLTSIINYVDLIRREDVQNVRVQEYIKILDAKSQRLKQLTEDLVEASKISSGNIEYHFEKLNFVELIRQTLGEFSEKFEEKQLVVVARLPEESIPILADSRRIWRVIENLCNNIYKYAMVGTRVYVDVEKILLGDIEHVVFSVKNISAQPLNIQAEELTERFIRGDVARSTEGSGLGLSIAKSLTEAQNGAFQIYLDGDLFKVTLEFPVYGNGEQLPEND